MRPAAHQRDRSEDGVAPIQMTAQEFLTINPDTLTPDQLAEVAEAMLCDLMLASTARRGFSDAMNGSITRWEALKFAPPVTGNMKRCCVC